MARPLAFSFSDPSVIFLIRRAMRRASRASALATPSCSLGSAQSSGRASGSATSGGHISTSPLSPRRLSWWAIASPSRVRSRLTSGSAKTSSTKPSTAAVERKDSVSATFSKARPTAAVFSVVRIRAWVNSAGSARWKAKIDCLASPTAKSVRSCSCAPAPLKNSLLSASISRHCSGLVSCASSTRI